MSLDNELIPGKVYRIAFTTAARCSWRVNPKRPTWRCKAAPVWIWEADEPDQDGRVKAKWVCDEHLAAMRAEASA